MSGLGLIPPSGPEQLSIVEPVACPVFMATGGISISANSAVLQLVRVSKAVTVTKLSCYTSAATTAVHMAIVSAAFNRLAQMAAKMTAVAGGLTTGTLEAAFTYEPGVDYYHVIVPDTTVAVIRGYTAVIAGTINAGTGPGTQRALVKAVGQDTVPASIVSPSTTSAGIWIAGHN